MLFGCLFDMKGQILVKNEFFCSKKNDPPEFQGLFLIWKMVLKLSSKRRPLFVKRFFHSVAGMGSYLPARRYILH